MQVEVTDAIRPGVVSLPHGWGHGLDGAILDAHALHLGPTGRERREHRRLLLVAAVAEHRAPAWLLQRARRGRVSVCPPCRPAR